MRLTNDEIARGSLAPETLRSAVERVKASGYVLFEQVLPKGRVAGLHATFLEVFGEYVKRTDPNRGANRYQMHLPFRAPFSDPGIVENPSVLPVIEALVGPDCVCHYFASDTPMPGSDFQKVHSDIHALFPEADIVPPAYSVVVNIPLIDFREDNGPLEIWPGGTHRMPDVLDIEGAAARMPSERVLMPAGSFLIRDLRMWHRGTPNRSNAPRPNLALIYSRHWLKTHYPPIEIPRAAYDGLSERAKRLFRFERIV